MRKRIGFLVDWIDSDYQVNLLCGIEIGACAFDFDVLTFVGGTLDNPVTTSVFHNDIYSFVTQKTVDAIILSSSSLSHSRGYEKIKDFCSLLMPLPIVSLSTKIEGVPSIVADNRSGFSSLVAHLINTHMHRRFIFIRGQEHMNDATERLHGFLSKLEENNIPLRDQLILPGDFTKVTGYEAIMKLNNQEILEFDAIIASNDEMAWGVQDALHEKGIKIPEDIALTGFDDQMISKYMNSPLSTVKQPVIEMGYRAIELIADLMTGKPVKSLELMETEVIIRDSCGCGLSPLYSDEREIGEYTNNYLSVENEFIQFRAISQRLVSITNIEELIRLFETELSRININFCLFALYEGESLKKHENAQLRVIFAYEKNKGMIKSIGGLRYPAMNLLPDNLFPMNNNHSVPYSLIVEPVFFGNKPLGIIFIDQNKRKEIVYNIMLRMFINTALKAAFFVQEVQSKAYLVEEANNKLQKTLSELKMTQEQAIESEKMAALGNLVAGMAHEINTPIGISVTASSHLDKITEELSKQFSENNLKKSELKRYIEKAREASRMILSNMQRSHELISSFKQVAVDQSVEEKRIFNVKEYINEILISIQPQLKKTRHIIEVQCPPAITISGYPGTLYQILSNLIMNSIKHAFPGDRAGRITINAGYCGNNLKLVFKDNGCGILKEHQQHIFEPFFTTKRTQGGTGLGLHLVYNLVKYKLKGNINFTSNPGKGTAFYIEFPAENRQV
ncbi:MAG: substrate-binding domain-containing protein [Spirochaetales bacterium]|nr:substrate-binding domain-containing protein [Spirochaetales bacterium]